MSSPIPLDDLAAQSSLDRDSTKIESVLASIMAEGYLKGDTPPETLREKIHDLAWFLKNRHMLTGFRPNFGNRSVDLYSKTMYNAMLCNMKVFEEDYQKRRRAAVA